MNKFPCIACSKPTDKRDKPCSRKKCIQARTKRKQQAVGGKKELRKAIADATPATDKEPRSKHVIEAETSDGPRVAKTSDDIDTDDLRDVTDRSKPIKRTPLDDRPKQPAYLKTVAQPVIPSTNTAAPYGFDIATDRPIGVMVGKPYVQPELKATVEPPSGPLPCGGCGQELCRHCHPENNVQVEFLRPAAQVELPSTQSRLEANLRRQLGITEPPLHFTTSPKSKPVFNFFPEILGITRKQLLGLFDAVVDTEVETVRLLETQIKSTKPVESQIVLLNFKIKHAQTRLHCLPLLVERSEKRILSWSARVIKYGTATIEPRTKDNYLDQKTREKYKYEENKKLEKFRHWETRLHKIIRDSQTAIEELQKRLDNWGSHPSDLENVTVTKDREIAFKEKFRETEQPINDLSDSYAKLLELHVTKTEAYISLLSTDYQMLADLSGSHPSLRPWRWFENEIVLQAIGFGLIRPTSKAFDTYPQLKKYLESEPEDDEIDDSALHGLILKTGGAEIGASIYDFGRDRRDQSRVSGSFDNTVDFANKNRTPADAPTASAWAGEIDSGDYAEDVASE
jgi:hypothetical protein